jgi:CHAT domain-containing protein
VSRAAIPRDTLTALVRAVRIGLGLARTRAAPGRVSARAALVALEASPVGEPAPTSAGDGGEGDLKRLAALLLPEELERQLAAAGDLVIVPNGPLLLLPFSTLPTGRSGEPLGLRYAVRFAPSLAALGAAEARPEHLAGRQRRAALAEALVVGNPSMPAPPGAARGRATLAALPSAEREARWVARQLGVRPLIGPGASESAVTSRLARAALVHLATHGVAFNSDEKARDSFIALAPDPASDGLLTVGEVLDDPALRLTAELVVLSACQTGLGHLRTAEGTIGLQRAFLARGARTVLVSLWSVSDKATELLMRRFYAHWLDDADAPSKAEALRRAQGDVQGTRQFRHPRNWAAFELVGAR